MATTLNDIYQALLSLTQMVSQVSLNVGQLPHSSATSSAAPSAAGAIVFASSQATAFLLMQSSSGATYKIPAYTV